MLLEQPNEQQWLEKRKQGIGGSECSAILGLNPYMSNVDLWMYKTGKKEYPDISNNECVRFGKENESILIEKFKDEYGKLYEVTHRDYDLVFSEKYNFLFGSLDGRLTNMETGEQGILEIKTCRKNKYNVSKWAGNSLPDNYYCQVTHYLLVTGYSYAMVYVQFRDWQDTIEGYKLYRIAREDKLADLERLEEAEANFWNYNVLEDIRPKLINGQHFNI